MRLNALTIFLILVSTAEFSAAEQETTETLLSHEYLFAPNKAYPYFETIADPGSANLNGFSIQTAAFLAQCSYLAYIRDLEFITAALSKAGFSEVLYFDQNDTFAYLAKSPEFLVLIFRGSETGNKTDYLTDAKIVQAEFARHGTAHSGFISALSEVDVDISKAIHARQREYRLPLLIAGHSLGGALSTLYGIKYPENVSGIYTFGAPRVGGKRFAAAANESEIPLFRFVHNNDMIPRVPTPPFYHHIGATYFLTSKAELVIDPPYSEKWKSRLEGHGEFMKQLYNEHWAKGDFNAIPSDYFADHSPRLYSDILISLATKTIGTQD